MNAIPLPISNLFHLAIHLQKDSVMAAVNHPAIAAEWLDQSIRIFWAADDMDPARAAGAWAAMRKLPMN